MDTFTEWPCPKIIKPSVLAEAGYFYAGFSDCVRCFSCGGGFRKWEYGDGPWEEHARWFPECMFLREQKGQEYIRLLSKGQIVGDNNDERRQGSENQDEKYDSVSQLDIPDPNLIYKNSNYVLLEETTQFVITSLEAQKAEEKLLEENRRLKELITCKIYLDHEAYIVFLPCGHLVSCSDCALLLETCAVCRAIIQGKVIVVTCGLRRS